MSQSPEEIRREIERTRAQLSDNVNALGDSAKPTNLAREQVDRVKDKANDLKTRVFGDPNDPWDEGAAGGVGHQLADARDQAVDAVQDAPRQLKQRTQGNPLAAGLIAFGLGALIGGLIPASRIEKDAALQVKDAAEPVVDQAKQMANEARDHLQPMAQEAADSVKFVAQDAGEQVKADAEAARDDVQAQAQSSADAVKSDAQGAVDETKAEAQEKRDQV
ncbi:DUF3618 domain-containing protein [Propioniciclava soli]|uniref:DUF3618 domain-containing protein n=1 Tax=Propioniciclava soli TaxID=2775081 RepID=A0ABZ3C4C0_9ACTN|nr:DUF3618 domain-containing protein [Propioniciclava soli]